VDTAIDLHWIPLGAGGHSVRFNGIIYESLTASVQRRPRHDIYHSALELRLSDGVYTVEMTPVPNARGSERGVVAEGPVAIKWAGRLRIFRYEVRRWKDGVIPDLGYAVSPPLHLTDDARVVRRVFELLPAVPALTWGRDESRAGEMWSCNSIISWALTRAGLEPEAIRLPAGGRAPGWDAGIAIARSGDGGHRHHRGRMGSTEAPRRRWTLRPERSSLAPQSHPLLRSLTEGTINLGQTKARGSGRP
jgi:hypothetical protein